MAGLATCNPPLEYQAASAWREQAKPMRNYIACPMSCLQSTLPHWPSICTGIPGLDEKPVRGRESDIQQTLSLHVDPTRAFLPVLFV